MSLSLLQAAVSLELRWMTTVHALAQRTDRNDAFLYYAAQVNSRCDKVLKYGAKAELVEGAHEGKVVKLLADGQQCLEMSNDISQRAADIRRQRKGERSENVELP